MNISGFTYFGSNLSKPSKPEAIREQAQVVTDRIAQENEKARQKEQQEFQQKQRDFLKRKLFALKINGQKTVLTGRDFLALFQPGFQFKDAQWVCSETNPRKTDPPKWENMYSGTQISAVARGLAFYLTNGKPEIAQIVPVTPLLPKPPFSNKTLQGELKKIIERAYYLHLIEGQSNGVSGPHETRKVDFSYYSALFDEGGYDYRHLFHYDVTIHLSEAAQSVLRGTES